MMLKNLASALLVFGLISPSAYAWGDLGHKTIGYLANAYLTSNTRYRVAAMLAKDSTMLTHGIDIGYEATWADEFRDSSSDRRDLTHLWHFADISIRNAEISAALADACHSSAPITSGKAASSGPKDDCVINRIVAFNSELSDPATEDGERLKALQFVLHFVGDVHQPLHAADDHDAGGNGKLVAGCAKGSLGKSVHRDKLHTHYDTTFVKLLGNDPQSLAAILKSAITDQEVAEWQHGSPQDWAIQANEMARRHAYNLPKPTRIGGKRVYCVSDTYINDAKNDVELQLKRAGVRLAWLLNAAFDPLP